MGIILARFRKKETTYEKLEKVDNEIKAIEEYGRKTELQHKKIVGRFIVVSVFIYLIATLVSYFYMFPKSLKESLIYIAALLFIPVMIFLLKYILTWWYKRKISKSHGKLESLKGKKKQILDGVMENETYKVAKTILDKFAPEETVKKTTSSNLEITTTPFTTSLSRQNLTGVRYRGHNQIQSLVPKPRASLGGFATPLTSGQMHVTPSRFSSTQTLGVSKLPGTPSTALSPRLPMARTVLPRDRTVLDKMVDYLVGDGPSNRYALICKQCSSHNGMALKEEFEYLSFRCCFCYTFNPARKQRPSPPRLELPRASVTNAVSDTSDSEKNSPSDSESDSDNDKLPLAITLSQQSASESPEPTNISDSERALDFDKLSDIDLKGSDNETTTTIVKVPPEGATGNVTSLADEQPDHDKRESDLTTSED